MRTRAAAIQRSRSVFIGLLTITVVLGLGSRQFASSLPTVVGRFAGDTLWASMVFWLLAVFWPRATTGRVALGALLIALTVELSQLCHAPWIEALRSSRVGALALGQGFLWSDLVCYSVGVGLAAVLDWRLVRDRRSVPAVAT